SCAASSSMHAEQTRSPELQCPRCGYSVAATLQAGHAGGEGSVVCPECGLASSPDELARDVACPPWLIESSAGRHGVVARFVRTVLRAFAPHRFWSAVRVSAPISWRGLTAFLIGIAISLHLLAVAAMVPVVLFKRNAAPLTGSHIPDLALVAVLPLCPMRADDILNFTAQSNPSRSVDGAVLWRSATGAVRLTFTRDKLWYETVPQDADATGPFVTTHWAFSRFGQGVFVADSDLLRAQRHLGEVLAVAAFPVVACALLALLLVLLRRAKLRDARLLRGCVYACAFAPVALALQASSTATALIATRFLPGMHAALDEIADGLMFAIPIGAVAFSAFSLDAFCTRYLVLPHGRVLAIMLNCVVLLAAIAISAPEIP
ncbi:MAG: hypothetical protein ACKO0W_06180, partial [Planctomycetota bacterium]